MKKLVEKMKKALRRPAKPVSSTLTDRSLRKGAEMFVKQYGEVIKKLSAE